MKSPSVPDLLQAAAETMRTRNAAYKNAWRDLNGKILHMLYPEGLTLKTENDFTKFHLLMLMVIKLTRITSSNLTHTDSCRDLTVYSTMLEAIIHEENQE